MHVRAQSDGCSKSEPERRVNLERRWAAEPREGTIGKKAVHLRVGGRLSPKRERGRPARRPQGKRLPLYDAQRVAALAARVAFRQAPYRRAVFLARASGSGLPPSARSRLGLTRFSRTSILSVIFWRCPRSPSIASRLAAGCLVSRDELQTVANRQLELTLTIVQGCGLVQSNSTHGWGLMPTIPVCLYLTGFGRARPSRAAVRKRRPLFAVSGPPASRPFPLPAGAA